MHTISENARYTGRDKYHPIPGRTCSENKDLLKRCLLPNGNFESRGPGGEQTLLKFFYYWYLYEWKVIGDSEGSGHVPEIDQYGGPEKIFTNIVHCQHVNDVPMATCLPDGRIGYVGWLLHLIIVYWWGMGHLLNSLKLRFTYINFMEKLARLSEKCLGLLKTGSTIRKIV